MASEETILTVTRSQTSGQRIAELAGRQHGVVARSQLLALGLGARAIQHRVEHGFLHRLHRGVYAVGHTKLPIRSAWMAATLAAGGVLSHRDAAALWGLRADNRARIDVTVPSKRRRPGLDVHVAVLAPDEITVIDGIPVTSLHRTLLDLAAVVAERAAERAMEQAIKRTLGDALPMRTLLARHPRHRGAKPIARILARGRLGRTWTRSELEEAFLAYAAHHRLTDPEMNAHVRALDGELLECDAVWRAARIAIELDSREWHDNAVSFGTDREKSRRLSAAGWHPIRVAPEHLLTPALAMDVRVLFAR